MDVGINRLPIVIGAKVKLADIPVRASNQYPPVIVIVPHRTEHAHGAVVGGKRQRKERIARWVIDDMHRRGAINGRDAHQNPPPE